MSRNEVTGELISVGADKDDAKYKSGWDAIWGKKEGPKQNKLPCGAGFVNECHTDAVCKSPLCGRLVFVAHDAYTGKLHDGGGFVEDLDELCEYCAKDHCDRDCFMLPMNRLVDKDSY